MADGRWRTANGLRRVKVGIVDRRWSRGRSQFHKDRRRRAGVSRMAYGDGVRSGASVAGVVCLTLVGDGDEVGGWGGCWGEMMEEARSRSDDAEAGVLRRDRHCAYGQGTRPESWQSQVQRQ